MLSGGRPEGTGPGAGSPQASLTERDPVSPVWLQGKAAGLEKLPRGWSQGRGKCVLLGNKPLWRQKDWE